MHVKQEGRNLLQKGQSLTEFAFSLIIILLLLVGIVDAARALFTWMMLRDASQEGALYASISPCDINQIRNHVRESSPMVRDLNLSPADIIVTLIGSHCTGGGVRVWVTNPNFRLTMPFLGAIIGSQTIRISAMTTDTILAPKCPNTCP